MRLVYVDGDHFISSCKRDSGGGYRLDTILVKYVGTTYTKSTIVALPTNLTGSPGSEAQVTRHFLSNNLTTDPKKIAAATIWGGSGVTTAYRGQAVSNIATVNTDNLSISWSNQVQIDTSNTNDLYYPGLAQSSGADQATLLVYTRSPNAYLRCQLYLSGSTSNNLSDRFIGFSSAGYTNGQAATINVIGATTTQSSLTPASDYYVTKTGALSTTAGVPSVKAGIAVSSTKLLIKGH